MFAYCQSESLFSSSSVPNATSGKRGPALFHATLLPLDTHSLNIRKTSPRSPLVQASRRKVSPPFRFLIRAQLPSTIRSISLARRFEKESEAIWQSAYLLHLSPQRHRLEMHIPLLLREGRFFSWIGHSLLLRRLSSTPLCLMIILRHLPDLRSSLTLRLIILTSIIPLILNHLSPTVIHLPPVVPLYLIGINP